MDQFVTLSEGGSLPNIDSHKGDKLTPQSDHTHIRMNRSDHKEVFDFMSLYAEKLVVSLETSKGGKIHCHCIMDVMVYGRDKKSTLFRLALIERFKLQGNGDYSISAVKSDKNCISYILKDGEFLYRGYSDEYIASRQKVSYKKYTKTAFAGDEEALRNEFITGKITDYEWVLGFIKLKHSYNQFNVNTHRLRDMLQNYKMKRSNTYLEGYAKAIIGGELYYSQN